MKRKKIDKAQAVIAWCDDENNDAYAPLDNLTVQMEEYLDEETYNKVFETIFDGMVKDGIIDPEDYEEEEEFFVDLKYDIYHQMLYGSR